MSNPFALAQKYLIATDEQSPSSVVESDTIHAVRIFSRILRDEIWLIFDRAFNPSDGVAIYYPEELPELRTKTAEQLREIHKAKLAFPGARVIQEEAEG